MSELQPPDAGNNEIDPQQGLIEVHDVITEAQRELAESRGFSITSFIKNPVTGSYIPIYTLENLSPAFLLDVIIKIHVEEGTCSISRLNLVWNTFIDDAINMQDENKFLTRWYELIQRKRFMINQTPPRPVMPISRTK